jgi:hypothetical protein
MSQWKMAPPDGSWDMVAHDCTCEMVACDGTLEIVTRDVTYLPNYTAQHCFLCPPESHLAYCTAPIYSMYDGKE